MRKAYTLTSGIIAIAIYLCLVGLLFWYFGYRAKEKNVGAKNEQIIAVDLSMIDKPRNEPSTPSSTTKKSSDAKTTPKQSSKQPIKEPIDRQQKEEPTLQQQTLIQKKTIPTDKPKDAVPLEKKIETKKIETKKIQEQKTIQKPKNMPTKTSDLFASIRSDAPIAPTHKINLPDKPSLTTKTSIAPSNVASQLINKEFSTKGEAGVEDAYKSKVKSILQGWPAQSSYAGERAKISFVIQPNGDFDFKVIQPSANEEFNQGLVQYLKQLKKVGFGPHAGSRAYLFDVNFIAEE